ncbi:MAG: tetratricopeptide repeat protein [Treponema sp.]|nr:tetratricopeptide repeat protein [Treponema sp.]
MRQMAEEQLLLVNAAADQGDFDRALALLVEARRLAASTDDPSLRVRTKLAEGNILAELGRGEEASAAWDKARAEAETSAQTELAALTRIYLARNALLTKEAPPNEVKASVNREIASIKNDRLAVALGWTVVGLAEKEIGGFSAAEAAFKKALDIHAKDNYLEQAAYDWYLIASTRSLSGNHDSAISALETALEFDRRAENTFGLASDWRLIGDIHQKFGKNAEAAAAFTRSNEIFASMGRNPSDDFSQAEPAR